MNFLNREMGKSVRLVDNPPMHNYVGAKYHIDPHPRFCFDDRVVVFTTTVRGVVDVAMAYTADLIARTTWSHAGAITQVCGENPVRPEIGGGNGCFDRQIA